MGRGCNKKASNNMASATKLQDKSEENFDLLLPW